MEHETAPSDVTSDEVLKAVSEAEDTPLTSLPALSDVINSDALNALFESRDETDGDVQVSFMFSASVVSLDYGDSIHIKPNDDQYAVGPDTGPARALKATIDRKW